jgi:hypothetical protein
MSFKEDFEAAVFPLLEPIFDNYEGIHKLVLADWFGSMLYTIAYGPCFWEWNSHPDNEVIYWAQLNNSGLLDDLSDLFDTYDKEQLAINLASTYGKSDNAKTSMVTVSRVGDDLIISEESSE